LRPRLILLAAVLTSAVSPLLAQTQVHPIVTTPRTPGDADDPAIWHHPTDPSKTVFIGVDKQEGVYVWDLAGEQLQHLPQGSESRINNVDVRYGFSLGGQPVDVVATNLRDAGKLAFFTVNPDYGEGNVLTQIAGLESTGNDLQNGSYGFTLYKRPSDGALFVIDRPSNGELRQYRIQDDGSGAGITVTAVRDLNYDGGLAEGFVADDVLGYLYVAEEDEAVHKYVADPDSGIDDAIGTFALDDGIEGDREGIALYACEDGSGYLVLSSQGNSTFKIYERQGTNSFVKTIRPLDHNGDPGLTTDGLDVTSTPAGSTFPAGFLVSQGGSRFHVYDWRDLAEDDLSLCGGPALPTPPTGLRVD
jgi:3-phytase